MGGDYFNPSLHERLGREAERDPVAADVDRQRGGGRVAGGDEGRADRLAQDRGLRAREHFADGRLAGVDDRALAGDAAVIVALRTPEGEVIEEDEETEGDEEVEATREEEPYFARDAAHRRVKRLPDIRQYL